MAGTVYNPTTISQSDGSSNINDTLGKAGELLDANLHGKYYTQAYRGAMFYAGTVAPTAPAIYTATAITSLSLWNPASSGKNIVVTRVQYAPATASSAVGVLGFTLIQNAGSGVATGGPISATTPLSTALRGGGLLNNSGQNSSIALVSTASTVVAPTQFIPGFFDYPTNTILTGGEGNAWNFDPEGSLILQPGSFIAFACNVAQTGTGNMAYWWYEAPL